jgi:hypothetical protein
LKLSTSTRVRVEHRGVDAGYTHNRLFLEHLAGGQGWKLVRRMPGYRRYGMGVQLVFIDRGDWRGKNLMEHEGKEDLMSELDF